MRFAPLFYLKISLTVSYGSNFLVGGVIRSH